MTTLILLFALCQQRDRNGCIYYPPGLTLSQRRAIVLRRIERLEKAQRSLSNKRPTVDQKTINKAVDAKLAEMKRRKEAERKAEAEFIKRFGAK